MNDGVSHERSPKELKGIHVLMWLMGFFGLMFAVNGVFLFHAITSFPGEDIQKSYLQGINYNDKLKDRALQMDRGWTAQMGLESRKLIVHLERLTWSPCPTRDAFLCSKANIHMHNIVFGTGIQDFLASTSHPRKYCKNICTSKE